MTMLYNGNPLLKNKKASSFGKKDIYLTWGLKFDGDDVWLEWPSFGRFAFEVSGWLLLLLFFPVFPIIEREANYMLSSGMPTGVAMHCGCRIFKMAPGRNLESYVLRLIFTIFYLNS